MKRNLNIVYTMLLISSMVFYACTGDQPVRKDTLLRQWQFTQDTTENPVWQDVTIPHDWAISGPFDRSNDLQEVIVVQNGEKEPSWKTGRSGGLPWMGKGHYRTRVKVNKDKFYTLVFDGAMSHADVYVNGEEVVYWPYGYNTFDCYILPQAMENSDVSDQYSEVTIDVFLENKPQQSRWYPGAGLYRNVHLVETNPIHIPTFGVLVRTPKVSKEFAQVTVEVELQDGVEELTSERMNELTNEGLSIQTDILYKGKVVATAEGQQGVAEVLNPQLWSPETPELYTARTRVYKTKDKGQRTKDEIVDEVETRFGIRSISYTPEGGFQLNGETRKFKGVCLHHDLGPLGAAVHKDALRHQITMLKEMGCDAIRTSHNMPAPELVELCDEMGMMMMIEPFDVWNQVLPDGIEIVTKLQDLFHRLDPTRPVTNGMDQAMHVIHNGFGAAVEIPGFNYRTGRYIEGYENLPQKMILGSETASTVSSRGVYKIPAVIQPDAKYEDNQSSGYDLEYCAWSGLPEQDFQLQDDYNWTLGQFVWTGFDYLGEPSPYDTDAWPSHSSYFGIIDLASLPKDRYWLYRSQWNKEEATLHLLPHWNWSEGDTVPVFCYTTYPSAELFVNRKSYGKLRFATKEESLTPTLSQGEGEKTAKVSEMPKVGQFEIPVWGSAPRPELLPRYRLMWFDVPFEKGEIEVVAYDAEGKEAAREKIRTAGEPDHLEVVWANEKENPEELCYYTVRVVDKDGNLCPKANNLICYEGNGFIAAANGDAACLDSFTEPHMHTFAGQCTFIIRKGAKGGFKLRK